MAILSRSLEKIAKLDRYTEAAVGKAEQAAKISNFIKHDKNSTGEDPYRQMVAAKRFETTEGSDNPYVLGDGLANRITETTSNQTFNMPIGATIEQFSTNIESDFGVFHAHVFNIISAGLASSLSEPSLIIIWSLFADIAFGILLTSNVGVAIGLLLLPK